MAFPEAVYTKTYHLRDRYNKSCAPGHVWKCDPAPSQRPIDRTPSKTRCGRSGPGCTWSSLACQQGCTEASHDLSIMTPFSCTAPTPASAAAERDALGLAPVPSTSMLALGDNMVSNVEAAAQSTTEQCSWSAPMAGSSHSCWLSSVLHQHDLSRLRICVKIFNILAQHLVALRPCNIFNTIGHPDALRGNLLSTLSEISAHMSTSEPSGEAGRARTH